MVRWLVASEPRTIAIVHLPDAPTVPGVSYHTYCVTYAVAKALADRVIEDLTLPGEKPWVWRTPHEAYHPEKGWIEIEVVPLHSAEDLSEVARGD